MALAVQKIEEMQGGIIMVARGEVLDALPLPVAGLISDGTPEETAATIRRLTKLAHGHYGISQDSNAFMPLSFLALPVIPYLKLTTKGLSTSPDLISCQTTRRLKTIADEWETGFHPDPPHFLPAVMHFRRFERFLRIFWLSLVYT